MFYFIFKFLLLFNYICPHFSPYSPLYWSHSTSHIQSSSTVIFVHGSFIHVPWLDPSPSFPHLSLSPLPSGHCQFVPYFHISGSILLICLFCLLSPLISEIIRYLPFAAWLISLSIILSSSIHDVAKGGSPFLLSAATIPLCKYTTVFWYTHLLLGTQAVSSTWLL